jgi:alginate O-acetyltransferase complex protein AlgI
MVFSSPLFLFGFFPIVLLLYWLSPVRWGNWIALASSLVFYAWGEPSFIFLALASALLDLVVVRGMVRTSDPAIRRALLVVGVAANLGLLAYFKYANFAVDSARSVAGAVFGFELPGMATLVLPLGISFVIFEKITYVVDVYRGIGRPARSVHDYLLYVFLFPKLLAGPIVKYHDIEAQLDDRPRRFDDMAEGLRRFAIGLAKKVLIADPMGELADQAYASGGNLGFAIAWLGAMAFAMQIYFDFSGYSDMAIGIARTMGFRLMENFNKPYISIGFADFWRRWHISLSSWIREYLYIPLGGDRVSPIRTYINLWICFLASGLWHGAAWTFVMWGIYHGLFLTLDRMFMRRALLRMPRGIAIGLTFILVTIGWAIFRAPDLPVAWHYLSVMANPAAAQAGAFVMTQDQWWILGAAAIICFLPAYPRFAAATQRLMTAPAGRTLSLAIAALLMLAALAKAVTVSFHPFLYFRF